MDSVFLFLIAFCSVLLIGTLIPDRWHPLLTLVLVIVGGAVLTSVIGAVLGL